MSVKSIRQNFPADIDPNLTIAQAFDAGWAAHRDGIHWKRCGLEGDLRHAWEGGWVCREAAGKAGVLK